MTQLIQQQLARAEHHQKQQVDRQHSNRNFEVGDSVDLKWQPFVQFSLVKHTNHKLAFKYFGPYHVVQKVGKVAFNWNSQPLHPST